MQSNVVVVTEPDVYYGQAPCILLIGCDDYLDAIVDNVRRLPIAVTIYTSSEVNTLDWMCAAYYQADITILNCEYDKLLTGFFIDKDCVNYYNNKQSYRNFNLNEAADPLIPLIDWINEWHTKDENHGVLL